MNKVWIFVLGSSLSALAMASDCRSYGNGWVSYANPDIGVQFCYPSKLIVQVEGSDIYIQKRWSGPHTKTILSQKNMDLLLNGKRLIEPNDYTLRIKVGRGDFIAANSKENIFIYEKGVVRVGIGRFDNSSAKVVRVGGWSGYKSEIICSTSDAKTGFHAAGGACLWVVGSDSRHNFVMDTLGDPDDATLAWRIAKSLRLIDEPSLSDKPNSSMPPGFNRMLMG